MLWLQSKIKRFFKKRFPRLYYSEKIQKFFFYLFMPSPIKYMIVLLIILIFLLIWGGLSTDDPMTRLTGYSDKEANLFEKNVEINE